MGELYPPLVDDSNPTIGGLLKIPQFVNYVGMTDADFPFIDIGLRLERLRSSQSDLSQKAWAERHNFNPTQYNNWAKGSRRIPVDAAEALCDKYGLTLDAIYRGRVAGLPDSLKNVF